MVTDPIDPRNRTEPPSPPLTEFERLALTKPTPYIKTKMKDPRVSRIRDYVVVGYCTCGAPIWAFDESQFKNEYAKSKTSEQEKELRTGVPRSFFSCDHRTRIEGTDIAL